MPASADALWSNRSRSHPVEICDRNGRILTQRHFYARSVEEARKLAQDWAEKHPRLSKHVSFTR